MEASLEPRFIGSQATPADSAMFSCEGASAKHESRLGAANLAHASPEPASVSIDASADHSTPFHLKPALPGQHQPSEAWGQEVDRRQELERPAANAERAEAADIGQVENEESVAAEDSAEKKCSQCAATKTPMWRNDIHGNKTLCNACGVRLQRQVNKAKQQAQALSEPPTSLIAGKLPRSRTSPAKLSRHDLGRSESMGSLVPLGSGHGSPSRTLTLVHGSEGEPQLTVLPATPKRKQGGEPSTHSSASPALDLERKRLRNERRGHERAFSLPVSGSPPLGGSLPWSVAPVDLLVPRLDGKRRVQNCTAKLDLPLQHGPGSGPGLLRIYLADGKEAATCGSPGPGPEPHYEPLYQAWMWDSPAYWSLMLTSKDVCTQFRGLLMRWVLHRRSESFQEPSPQARLWQEQQASVTLAAGFRPNYKADEEDQKFLEHVNSKIRMQPRDADGGDCPAGRDPKALSTPLAQETFERLIETFEILLARTKAHQMTVGNVVLLSQKCAWAPNRAVTLTVHSYWVRKLQRTGRPACFQKAAAAFPAGGGSPQGLTRSFSASPVVGSSGRGPPLYNPTSSGLSDMSAMTLEDLSKQRRAASETSEDTQALQGLNGDAAALPGSLGFTATATPSPLSMAQDLEMQGGPSAGSCAQKQEAFISQPVGNMFALPSWQLHGTAFASPGLPGYTNIDQDQEDLDPLDPERLARIADPHEPRLSPGDERSDQTNSMEAQKSMTPPAMDDVGIGASAAGPSCGDEAGCGTVVSRPEGVHSDGAFHRATPLNKQPAILRRVASLLEAPEVMRSTSPGTPTSGRNAAGTLLHVHCGLTKHSSLDQPGHFRKPVFPSFGGSGLQHQEDLTAVERENDSFFDKVLDMQ